MPVKPSLFLTFLNMSLLTKKRGVWGENGDVLTFLRYGVDGGLPEPGAAGRLLHPAWLKMGRFEFCSALSHLLVIFFFYM